MRAPILVLCILCFISSMALGAVIHVPKDYPKIQTAIDAAANGDTIIVAPGTYPERIDFKSKAIDVQGSGGAEATVIDGMKQGSVVTALNGTGPAALSGFTITNGWGTKGLHSHTYGGGIYIVGGTAPVIYDVIVKKNWAVYGGGIYCEDATLEVRDSTLRKNYFGTCGGGLHAENATVLVEGNQLFKNYGGKQGGGIYCHDGQVTIRDNVIYENSAGGGGGVALSAGDSILENNRIHGNSVTSVFGGGGVLVLQGTVRNNVILSNESVCLGGGVSCIGTGEIVGNEIRDNIIGSSYGFGAGIGCYFDATPVIRDNLIIGNSQASLGGGVYCENGSTVLLQNNRIIGNSATDLGGGITCNYGSNATITNNTLHGNSAARGGGLACAGPEVVVDVANTIFWNDQAPLGKEILALTDNKTVLSISHSLVEGGFNSVYIEYCTLNWGPQMLDQDPSFIDPAGGDFHIRGDSCCIGQGDPDAAGFPLLDFEGDSRSGTHASDLGADEFHDHLYVMGDFTPGGSCVLTITGTGGIPTLLWLGSGVLNPPLPTSCGDWYLAFPLLTTLDLGLIPFPDGYKTLPFTVPSNLPVPTVLPMQALFYKGLSNLEVMVIDS